MAEWLYEAGIGEARAALVERGRLLEMAIDPDDGRLRAGAIVEARVVRGADAGGRVRIVLDDGGEAWLLNAADAAEGRRLAVEIVREALIERGGAKIAHARRAPPEATPREGRHLAERLAATGLPVVSAPPSGVDRLEEHGWSAAMEEAVSGIVAGPHALLRLSLTPAMTLIDVDGSGPPAALACAGATLAGETIRRFGIAGSIGIDLPTLAGKADRQAAAAALDAALPPPFERTAVNGFGFLQLVRRRTRASLPEQIAADPHGAAARALLRRAERAGGRGPLHVVAASAVIARLEARPGWIAALERRIGAPVTLRPDASLAISAGHAQRETP